MDQSCGSPLPFLKQVNCEHRVLAIYESGVGLTQPNSVTYRFTLFWRHIGIVPGGRRALRRECEPRSRHRLRHRLRNSSRRWGRRHQGQEQCQPACFPIRCLVVSVKLSRLETSHPFIRVLGQHTVERSLMNGNQHYLSLPHPQSLRDRFQPQ